MVQFRQYSASGNGMMIGAALDRCDWFVVLRSPEAVESKWVKRELCFALENDAYNNRIVPVPMFAAATTNGYRGLCPAFR